MIIDTIDLEQYHDGELDETRARRVAEVLRDDADARRRFAETARLDTLARGMLLAEPSARRSVRLAWPVVAAVGVAAVVTVVAWRLAVPATVPPTNADAAPSEPPILRLIATIPVSESWVRPTVEAPAFDAAEFDDLLARGRTDEAMGQLGRLEGAERGAALVRLGRARVAADTSRAILDSLPAAMQVEACRAWAEDPSLRPVAFERLAALRTHAEVGAGVAALIEELRGRRDLIAWVRSYLGKDPA